MGRVNGIDGRFFFPSSRLRREVLVVWQHENGGWMVGEVAAAADRRGSVPPGATPRLVSVASSYAAACEVVEALLFGIDRTPEFDPATCFRSVFR